MKELSLLLMLWIFFSSVRWIFTLNRRITILDMVDGWLFFIWECIRRCIGCVSMLRTWKEVILYLWECIFEFVQRHRDQSNSATKLRLMSGPCTWMDWKYCDHLLEIINLLVQDFLWTFPEIYTFVPWNQSLVLTIMISPVRITLRHFYSMWKIIDLDKVWLAWLDGRRRHIPEEGAGTKSSRR